MSIGKRLALAIFSACFPAISYVSQAMAQAPATSLPAPAPAAAAPASTVPGQPEVRYLEENGQTIRETRTRVRVPTTEVVNQPQSQTFYTPKYSSQTQQYQRAVSVPVVEYQWQPRYYNTWNPFGQPYVAYQWVPVTRWETRNETVSYPYTKSEWVAETRTVNYPTQRLKFVEEERIVRTPVPGRPGTAVAAAPAAPTASVAPQPLPVGLPPYGVPAVATYPAYPAYHPAPIGGVYRMHSDPPRAATTVDGQIYLR